jgi:hypothetical protein
MTAPFPSRIVALDPVLGRSLSRVDRGGIIGVRIRRAVTRRLSAEVSVDYAQSQGRIAPVNRDAIEATRASFISAFTALIASNPGRVLRSVTSTATVEGGRAHHLFTSAAVIINLRPSARLAPFATAGGGFISVHGKRPSAKLEGNYQFSNLAGAIFNETDTVTVTDGRTGARSQASWAVA